MAQAKGAKGFDDHPNEKTKKRRNVLADELKEEAGRVAVERGKKGGH